MELWNLTMAVNVTGTFNLTRLVLQHLVKVAPEEGPDGERGVVIFVASEAAVRVICFIVGGLLSSILFIPVPRVFSPSLVVCSRIPDAVRRPAWPDGVCSKQRRHSVHDAPYGTRLGTTSCPRGDDSAGPIHYPIDRQISGKGAQRVGEDWDALSKALRPAERVRIDG
jgi:hypothetical protein